MGVLRDDTYSRLVRVACLVMATTRTVAFTCRTPSNNPIAIQASTRTQRLHSTLSEEDVATLLDEAVLLYSAVDYASQSSDESVSDEMKQLRRTEVSSLVEDMILASSSSETSLKESLSKPQTEKLFDDMSLVELSQQLDQAILEGYQSTCSEEELDAWTERIETIQVSFEAKMAQQSIVKEKEPASLVEKSGPTYGDFETRLRQLQTVIPIPPTWCTTNIATPTTLPEKVVPNTVAQTSQKADTAKETESETVVVEVVDIEK
jgi:hypothetical protein